MPQRIVFLVWRDTAHPEGGGSEQYVERVAAALAARGDDVTIVCAAHANAPRDEVRDGVRFRRRGGRFAVYLRGLLYIAVGAGRHADVVVDVQNGLPFWTGLVRRRRPLVVLVHHCHREQWQILFPGAVGRVGAWLETRLSPRVYRGRPYLTISEATGRDLEAQGVPAHHIRIVMPGLDVDVPEVAAPRADVPTICVLGRLVPHKQVEHALTAVAVIRERIPDVRLDVVGDGWWHDALAARAAELDITAAVTFHRFLPVAERDRVVAASWVLLMPSVREGWGIAVMEAAALGVPAIAYRGAGGVTESIVDHVTGHLVDDVDDLVKACEIVLTDAEHRDALGAAARGRAATFSWERSAGMFAAALDASVAASGSAQRVP